MFVTLYLIIVVININRCKDSFFFFFFFFFFFGGGGMLVDFLPNLMV